MLCFLLLLAAGLKAVNCDSRGFFQKPTAGFQITAGEKITISWLDSGDGVAHLIESMALHSGDPQEELNHSDKWYNYMMDVPLDLEAVHKNKEYTMEWAIPKDIEPGKDYYFRMHAEPFGWLPVVSARFEIKAPPPPANIPTKSQEVTKSPQPTPTPTPTPTPPSEKTTTENSSSEASETHPTSTTPALPSSSPDYSEENRKVLSPGTSRSTSSATAPTDTVDKAPHNETEEKEDEKAPLGAAKENNENTPEGESDKKSISTGTLIGIVVGAALAGTLSAACLVLILCRRRRRRGAVTELVSDEKIPTCEEKALAPIPKPATTFVQVSEFAPPSMDAYFWKGQVELGSQSPVHCGAELPSDAPVISEMGTTVESPVHELGWSRFASMRKSYGTKSSRRQTKYTDTMYSSYSIPILFPEARQSISTLFNSPGLASSATLASRPEVASPQSPGQMSFRSSLQPKIGMFTAPTFTAPADELAWLETEGRRRRLLELQQQERLQASAKD